MWAASGWPCTPKTPHSSWKRSPSACGEELARLLRRQGRQDAVGIELGGNGHVAPSGFVQPVLVNPLRHDAGSRRDQIDSSDASSASIQGASFAPAMRSRAPPVVPIRAAGTPARGRRGEEPLRIARRHDHPARALAEQQRVDAQAAGKLHLRSDAQPARAREAALRQGDREPSAPTRRGP